MVVAEMVGLAPAQEPMAALAVAAVRLERLKQAAPEIRLAQRQAKATTAAAPIRRAVTMVAQAVVALMQLEVIRLPSTMVATAEQVQRRLFPVRL